MRAHAMLIRESDSRKLSHDGLLLLCAENEIMSCEQRQSIVALKASDKDDYNDFTSLSR